VTFPPDEIMLTLTGLWVGGELQVNYGSLWLVSPDLPEPMPVASTALDALEDRGWLKVTEAGVEMDEDKARYVLRRWFGRKGRAFGGQAANRVAPGKPVPIIRAAS